MANVVDLTFAELSVLLDLSTEPIGTRNSRRLHLPPQDDTLNRAGVASLTQRNVLADDDGTLVLIPTIAAPLTVISSAVHWTEFEIASSRGVSRLQFFDGDELRICVVAEADGRFRLIYVDRYALVADIAREMLQPLLEGESLATIRVNSESSDETRVTTYTFSPGEDRVLVSPLGASRKSRIPRADVASHFEGVVVRT